MQNWTEHDLKETWIDSEKKQRAMEIHPKNRDIFILEQLGPI